jgi:hypothetical protein
MNPLTIPILALLIPIVVAPTAMWVKYAQRQRELEHAERIRALELGRTLPQDEPWWSPAKLSAAIGVGVPSVAMFCAYWATESVGFRDGIWVSSMLVGMSGVICGTVLASQHLKHRAEAQRAADRAYAAKPPVDADAFDVVASRG